MSRKKSTQRNETMTEVLHENFSAYNNDGDVNPHGAVARMAKWIENRVDEIEVVSIVPTEISRTGAVGAYSVIYIVLPPYDRR